MKRLSLCLLFAVALTVGDKDANSQVFYSYPSGAVLEEGKLATGPYLAAGENELFRLSGFGRTGVSKYVDAGLEFLFDNQNSDWLWGLGVDAKLRLFPETNAIPFDLALNAGFGFRSGGGTKLLQFPLGGIISSPFRLDRGSLLTPFLGVYLLIDRSSIELPGGDATDTDLDAELRGGLHYTLTERVALFGALHIGRDALFLVGFGFSP